MSSWLSSAGISWPLRLPFLQRQTGCDGVPFGQPNMAFKIGIPYYSTEFLAMPHSKPLKRDAWVESCGSTPVRRISMMVRRGLFYIL